MGDPSLLTLLKEGVELLHKVKQAEKIEARSGYCSSVCISYAALQTKLAA